MTGHPGIFAGGDMIHAERTVTTAAGHGRRAARHIDAWLRGTEHRPPARPELAAYDRLNPW
jgi:NADPH-dependent glutamate synthase beta subunit-like oxidoreductase